MATDFVQGWENRPISRQVYALVYKSNGIGIEQGNCIAFSIMNMGLVRAILLGGKTIADAN